MPPLVYIGWSLGKVNLFPNVYSVFVAAAGVQPASVDNAAGDWEQPCWEGWGVAVDGRLEMTQQCVIEEQSTMPQAGTSEVWPATQGMQFCPTQVRPCPQSCLQPCGPQHQNDMELQEWIQRRPWRCFEGWRPSALETGGETWGCSTWGRGGSRGPIRASRGLIRKMVANFMVGSVEIKQGVLILNQKRVDLD